MAEYVLYLGMHRGGPGMGPGTMARRDAYPDIMPDMGAGRALIRTLASIWPVIGHLATRIWPTRYL